MTYIKITISERRKKPDKYIFHGKNAYQNATNLITKKYNGVTK